MYSTRNNYQTLMPTFYYRMTQENKKISICLLK